MLSVQSQISKAKSKIYLRKKLKLMYKLLRIIKMLKIISKRKKFSSEVDHLTEITLRKFYRQGGIQVMKLGINGVRERLLDFFEYLSSQKKWIQCDCRKNEVIQPILVPCIRRETGTAYFKRLEGAPMHSSEPRCDFYGIKKSRPIIDTG